MSTKIEWTNETWNPVIGCNKISEGCRECYAEKFAYRLSKNPKTINYKVIIDPDTKKWNGKNHLVEEAFYKPLSWKKPRKVFVCSMGDLFHENIPFENIDMVMAIICLSPDHIFQVLTKRHKRMYKYFSSDKDLLIERWENACYKLGVADKNDDIDTPPCFVHNRCHGWTEKTTTGWPLINLWLGVTIENQPNANDRIYDLLRIPAAIHFVSAEPLLGPINLQGINGTYVHFSALEKGTIVPQKLDWVIAGGETGHHARPMHPDWVRSLRDQCREAEVPFFFKGWGQWAPDSHVSVNGPFNIRNKCKHRIVNIDGKSWAYATPLDKYYSEEEIEENYKCPLTKENNAFWMAKIGKKNFGRLLDGNTYNEMPLI